MNIPWEDIQLFLAVAEERSMTGAARRLGVAQPTVSRRLAALEARVGEPLFQRSIEGVSLTSFGESLLAPSRRVAEWAAEVERAADRADVAPRGVVRITAPPGIAHDFLAPFAARLRQELPEVQLEVVATIQYLDLARREADLALRLQRPAQRDMVLLSSLEIGVGAFASRGYAARLPERYGLADLDWITWAPPLDHLAPTPQLRRLIPGFRPAFAADDFLVQLQAAEAGVGVLFLGRARHPFMLPTALVELPLDLPLPGSELHLIAARTAMEIPRVKSVAELLAREMARVDTGAKRPRSSR
jgi:DNA-binding transcriptional LysR family regulator